jgi:hypothetical protein
MTPEQKLQAVIAEALEGVGHAEGWFSYENAAQAVVEALGVEPDGWIGVDYDSQGEELGPYWTRDIGEPEVVLYPVYRIKCLEQAEADK